MTIDSTRRTPLSRLGQTALLLLSLSTTGGCVDAPQGDEPLEAELYAQSPDSLRCLPADGGVGFDFYAWDGSLPAENGAVIRCQPLADYPPDAALKGYRVLYRTTMQTHTGSTATDVPVPASGTIWIPSGAIETPDGGVAPLTRPVVANTHGAVGVLAKCGPSRKGDWDKAQVERLSEGLRAKPVVVVPDYVGLGIDPKVRVAEKDYLTTWPNGVKSAPFSDVSHPFVSLEGEGRATIDLVRAAKHMPDAKLSAGPVKWVTFGQSQGGHAAIATAEVMARGYASKTEFPLVGVVAGAPATELHNPNWWTKDLRNAVFGMLTASLPLEWRDVRASDYLSENGAKALGNTTNSKCFVQDTLIETLSTYNLVDLFDVEPFEDPKVTAILEAISPGKTAVDVPLFVGTVRGDPLINHRRVGDFVELAPPEYKEQITFCEYWGGTVTNKDQQYWYSNIDWRLRAGDHDAFKKMFADKKYRIHCTTNGASTPTTPVEFVRSLAW